MRGFKLTVAVLTIIEGAFAILGGIAAIVIGSLLRALDWNWDWESILGNGYQDVRDTLPNFDFAIFMSTVLIVGGIIAIGLGIMFLIFGIKFCSHKPNKGIAITLLVFNAIGLVALFIPPFAGGVIAALNLAFLIVYLVKLGKHNQPPAFPTNSSTPPENPWQPQNTDV